MKKFEARIDRANLKVKVDRIKELEPILSDMQFRHDSLVGASVTIENEIKLLSVSRRSVADEINVLREETTALFAKLKAEK